MFLKSLGGKLIFSVGLILILSIGVFAFISIRNQQNQLINEVILGAKRFSDTILRSTHYYMLKFQREDIHRIIESIGALEGIEQVRIFNKEGVIIYSTSKSEIGKKVDMEAEACYACHSAKQPLERLSTPDRTRIYRIKDGHRVLGMITGIYNEPVCYNADCHAHPQEKKVLGVLDIDMSLKDVDRNIAVNRKSIVFFALMEIVIISVIIGAFIHRSVITPINQLVSVTKKIAAGDLSHRIKIKSEDEFGVLAEAFNKMTENLEEAKNELTNWAKTLEQKVEERTEALRKAQAQLIQSEKLASLGKLAAGVAHELNNPLTGVLTYSSLMYDSAPEGSQEKEDLGVIINETKRCREIIKDLLNFARQNKPTKREVNINSVLEATLAVLKYQALFRNIEIIKEFEPSLPTVRIDDDQFKQVFMNLIVNAAEAMPNGGKLTLRTKLSEDGEFIELYFIDTGIGIKKEHLNKIFEPFFTTKDFGKGTGLGLAVTYGIIQRHHGSISVESQVGVGTTFIIKLPVKPIADEEENVA